MKNNRKSDVDLISILAKHNVYPEFTRNNCSWFNSPFREEKQPSFKVDTNKNLWYDFGLGEGGDAIKLLCKINNLSPKEVFRIITGNVYTEFKCASIKMEESPLEILEATRPIKHPALVKYLSSRLIDLNCTLRCEKLNEIKYRVRSKTYFALGFSNDKGGFEIRNTFWKGASSPKSITTIQGESKILNVFEGFMDYLSALTYYKINQSVHTSIILNGTGQTQQLIPLLPQFKKVFLFVDNDNAGKKVVAAIKQNHLNVTNVSKQLYPNSKDFNEFIILKNDLK